MTSTLAPSLSQLDASFVVEGGRTRLDRVFESGALRLRHPRGPGCEGIIVNTGGGIVGGDRLASAFALAPGAAATLTTVAAEKVYRSSGATARIETALTLGAHARFDWLPQETILFDGAALSRRLRVDMHETATLLLAESRVLGRRGSGETTRRLALDDRTEITRGGRPILVDAMRLQGDADARLQRAATGNGATAMATVVLAAPDAASRLDGMRALLADVPEVEGGVSAWDGMLVIRTVAREAARQMACIMQVLGVLRDGRTQPQVWRT